MKSQLKDKHRDIIWNGFGKDIGIQSNDHSNISIQFAVECLKGVLKDFHNRNNLVEMLNGGKYKSIDNIIFDKIKEIEQ